MAAHRKQWARLYKTKQWARLRRSQLEHSPLCKYCLEQGRFVSATVVDHRKPHKGDHDLFSDPDNLQSLCKTHHDSTKQREEASGKRVGCDEQGYPLDSEHHWSGHQDRAGAGRK